MKHLFIFTWICEFCGEVHRKRIYAEDGRSALNKFVAGFEPTHSNEEPFQLPLMVMAEEFINVGE